MIPPAATALIPAGVAPTVAGVATALLVATLALGIEGIARTRRAVLIAGRLRPSVPHPARFRRARAALPAAPPWFARQVEALGFARDPDIVAALVVAVLVLAVVAALAAGGWALVLIVLAATAGAGWFLNETAHHRAERAVERDLPAILDAVSDAMRSGSSLGAALTEAVAVARGVARTDLQATIGDVGRLGVAGALHEWGERRPAPSVRLSVAALSLAAALGGSAQPVDGVAATLRERMAVEREARALTAQARSSAAVIIVAPLVFVALMAMADDTVVPFFLHTSLGLACIAGGVALDGAGAWWMLRILRSAS
jgi:tight adherence protein B